MLFYLQSTFLLKPLKSIHLSFYTNSLTGAVYPGIAKILSVANRKLCLKQRLLILLIGIRVSYRKCYNVIQPSHNDSESVDTAAMINNDLQASVLSTTVALSQY